MFDESLSELRAWLPLRAGSQPDQLALWRHDGHAFVARTWREIAEDVARTAAVFHSLGLRVGDRVVQVAENRYEWLVVDLALLGLGVVHVPLHVNLPTSQAARQIRRAEPEWLVVSDAVRGAAIRHALRDLDTPVTRLAADAVGRETPRLIAFGSADDSPEHGSPEHGSLAFPHLLAAADPAEGRRAMERANASIHADTPATILFTSGTLTEPKGVVLTHGNLRSNALGIRAAFHERTAERRVCALPLSHIYARTCDLYAWLASGGELALARRPDTLLADCQVIRPTFLNGVPYLFDRIRRRWLAEESSAGVSLRELLGGKVELCVCGGAALPDDVYDFYHEHRVPLLPGYGLTEASPVVTASTLSHVRRGGVGRPIPGVEVRLAPDGEILTRGPHVMLGYWQDPIETAITLQDGWLHTGDLGRWEDDEFLRIVGRKKELIVLSIGKNVAPASLEALLASDPWIAQAAVFGEGRPYLVALVAPLPEVLPRIAAKLGLADQPPAEFARHPAVHDFFAERLGRLNERLAPHEQIRRFALTDRPFLLEREELTAKLTLRRGEIARNFAATIAALYEQSPPEPPS